MLKIALFAGGNLTYFESDVDYYVGVDRGSLFLLEKALPLDMAVGDFDSVSAEELALIKEQSSRLIVAPAEKDDTDTELALKTVFKEFPKAQVTLYGTSGGRLDHQLSNLFLPSDDDLNAFMRQFCLRDEQNLVRYYPAGHHEIPEEKEMTYVAFMVSGDGQLTITNAKYDLQVSRKKIYTSNEFIGQPIRVTVDKGYLIVMYSKDRI